MQGQRSLRLSVRTAASHVAKTGSTPVGSANALDQGPPPLNKKTHSKPHLTKLTAFLLRLSSHDRAHCDHAATFSA